ncbi:MAG: hypothetical protein Q8888_00835 [Vigna little leaf phytoplasma]|nr:hypothetical protein [Vigna little leaf phytoplasma]
MNLRSTKFIKTVTVIIFFISFIVILSYVFLFSKILNFNSPGEKNSFKLIKQKYTPNELRNEFKKKNCILECKETNGKIYVYCNKIKFEIASLGTPKQIKFRYENNLFNDEWFLDDVCIGKTLNFNTNNDIDYYYIFFDGTWTYSLE